MGKYKTFKIERLDTISPTFCAAKWLMADFYLHKGTTSSCHLPIPDKIDLSLCKTNINYLNNTKEKIQQKKEMLLGNKPTKCSSCWNTESIDEFSISDRVIHSEVFSNYNFSNLNLDINQKPSIVTVSFDNLCNFFCSYCDASQSSSWETDLKINGPYKNIKGDPQFTYQRLGYKDRVSDYTLIFNLFLEYISGSQESITHINCLGGEPLNSINFWNFINDLEFKKIKTENIHLSAVTNLSNLKNIKKFIKLQNRFKSIKIKASIENIKEKGEFIRGGLHWNKFLKNLNFLITNNIDIDLLSTYSGVALDGITDFLDWYLTIEKHADLKIYKIKNPNFQSIEILPEYLKSKYKDDLAKWLDLNINKINRPGTLQQLYNIYNSLSLTTIDCDIKIAQNSAKEFYQQYATRHNFNIEQIFSKELSNWILTKE